MELGWHPSFSRLSQLGVFAVSSSQYVIIPLKFWPRFLFAYASLHYVQVFSSVCATYVCSGRHGDKYAGETKGLNYLYSLFPLLGRSGPLKSDSSWGRTHRISHLFDIKFCSRSSSPSSLHPFWGLECIIFITCCVRTRASYFNVWRRRTPTFVILTEVGDELAPAFHLASAAQSEAAPTSVSGDFLKSFLFQLITSSAK